MSVPFHKQTDPAKMAGQAVFQDYKQETTLAQYIERKTDEPKKITFDVWLQQQIKETGYEDPWQDSHAAAQDAWNAALAKGKL